MRPSVNAPSELRSSGATACSSTTSKNSSAGSPSSPAAFDLPAAEGICAAHLDTLHSLVDKSLLGFEGDRFTMLETIREFAAERLWASPEAHDRRRRHARHFADAAERMEVEHSTMQGAELRRLWTGIRADYDNLRVAFDWAVEQRERELALRLVGVGPLTYAGTVPDGQRLVEVALALEGNSSMRAEAAALQRGGQLAYEAEDIVTSLALLERSLAGYRILGDVESILDALTDLAQSEAAHGEVDDARAHLHEAIERSRQISSTDQLAAALHSLGELERDHGRHSISAELLEEALELWERGGHLRHAGETRHGLADLRLAEGEHKAAVQLYRATLVQCRNEDNKRGIAYALGGLAAAAAATGQLERAGRLWESSSKWKPNAEHLWSHSRGRDTAASLRRSTPRPSNTRSRPAERFHPTRLSNSRSGRDPPGGAKLKLGSRDALGVTARTLVMQARPARGPTRRGGSSARGRRSRPPRRGRGRRGRRHARSACRAAPPATQRRQPPSPRRAHAPGRPRPRARREAEASPTEAERSSIDAEALELLRGEVDPVELVVDPDVPDEVRKLERDPEPPERLGLASRTQDRGHDAADRRRAPIHVAVELGSRRNAHTATVDPHRPYVASQLVKGKLEA